MLKGIANLMGSDSLKQLLTQSYCVFNIYHLKQHKIGKPHKSCYLEFVQLNAP